MTIEIVDDLERVLHKGRYGTDTHGYRQMLAAGRQYPHRVWAVEGCAGIGRHIAQRLVADGETVLDVPAKLSARVRVFNTGQGRKTDPVDAVGAEKFIRPGQDRFGVAGAEKEAGPIAARGEACLVPEWVPPYSQEAPTPAPWPSRSQLT